MTRQQRQALDSRLRSVTAPPDRVSTAEMRANFARFMGHFPIRTDVRQTSTVLTDRRAVLVEPVAGAQNNSCTIVYFHGGSFSLGSPETAMPLTSELVARSGVRAISLDYRLAPEHPFPAAIEDGVAAYRALLEDGFDPASIVFAGDSAGGGLTVTTSLAARDAGLPVPAAIVAFSPGLDHTRSGASMRGKDGIDPFFSYAGLERSGDLYLDGQDPHQPLAAPAVYADLTGLPPMLLQVGTNELLLDDAVRLAGRAREAEVDVILDVTSGVPHVFQAFIGDLDEAHHALDRAALFVRQQLNLPTGIRQK